MNFDDIIRLCKDHGIPTIGWRRTSIIDNSIQFYDHPFYKAQVNTVDGKVAIFDRKLSVLFPVIDNGNNLTTEMEMTKREWKMLDTGKGYRIAECITGVA